MKLLGVLVISDITLYRSLSRVAMQLYACERQNVRLIQRRERLRGNRHKAAAWEETRSSYGFSTPGKRDDGEKLGSVFARSEKDKARAFSPTYKLRLEIDYEGVLRNMSGSLYCIDQSGAFTDDRVQLRLLRAHRAARTKTYSSLGSTDQLSRNYLSTEFHGR